METLQDLGLDKKSNYTTIYGLSTSDEEVVFENGLKGTVELFAVEEGKIAFGDGTLVEMIRNDTDGWKIRIMHKGSAFIDLYKSIIVDEDYDEVYSDVLVMNTSAAKWAIVAGTGYYVTKQGSQTFGDTSNWS